MARCSPGARPAARARLTARGSIESAAIVTTCDFNVCARWADQHWSA
ncbi:hypothetical protein [Actinoplanes sp. NPDC089786]